METHLWHIEMARLDPGPTWVRLSHGPDLGLGKAAHGPSGSCQARAWHVPSPAPPYLPQRLKESLGARDMWIWLTSPAAQREPVGGVCNFFFGKTPQPLGAICTFANNPTTGRMGFA